MLLNGFKNTVDRYSPTITNRDLLRACLHLGIETTTSYSTSQVTDKLYENIKYSLEYNNDIQDAISVTALMKLQSELIYRYVLYDEDPVEYLKILKVINDSCRGDVKWFPAFSDQVKWEAAIINCKNFNNFSPNTHSILFDDLRKDYPKDFDIANSIKRLLSKGCKIEIKDSNFHILSGLESVVREIDEKVRAIGGIVLAECLFNHLNLQKKYSPKFERYFITREASGISFDQHPQIPYGFLLNLSLKYPYKNLRIKNLQSEVNDIVDLAIIVSNSFGVQQYNFWEFHFHSGDTIVQFYTDIVLWDTIFSIPQCRPSSQLEICNNLFLFISDEDFQKALGFTRADLISVSAELNKLATKIHSPNIVYHSALCKSLKQIDKGKIQSILDLLSHPTNPNEKYILPTDYTSIDFWKKPLIKLGQTKFLLFNKSFCAPNFFEAIVSTLRTNFKSVGKDLDNELGVQLENFLQNKMSTKGINFLTGDYVVDGLHGECDFLIETDKAIVLIEFKKKVLTRKARSGIDIDVFIDLSESVLGAQIQAGRTEIILREKGRINLKARSGSTQTVALNGRSIERVALTQLEFGGFHDRSIFKHFLVALITHSYETHSTEKRTIEKFQKLKEKQLRWVEQYDKLCAIDTNYPNHAFFNCWFMSLPQLIEVINLSKDSNSFYEMLSKTRFLSLNTLDWYREFDFATQIQGGSVKETNGGAETNESL